MSIVKTAVSLPEDLYERAEALARSLKTSRSRLYALALEEYLRRHEEERLVEQINAVCDAADANSDERLIAGHRRLHREVVEGEW
jgi:metal-responsive CopG/Arc/MetJ family transcriptional regulator